MKRTKYPPRLSIRLPVSLLKVIRAAVAVRGETSAAGLIEEALGQHPAIIAQIHATRPLVCVCGHGYDEHPLVAGTRYCLRACGCAEFEVAA